MDVSEAAFLLALELVKKSGVREWDDPAVRLALVEAANEMAENLLGECMATSKLLLDEMDGTPKQICFADHATDFTAPTAANDLRKTTDGSQELDVQLDLTSLANNAARQSAKFDFGDIRAPLYRARAAFELAATPTAGQTIELWFAPSSSATAGTGNPGGVSGSDAAYAGYSSNLDASIKQLQYIGEFVVTTQVTTTVQIAECGLLVPRERYGSLIIYNKSGAAFHSDAAEINIVLDPVFIQGQAA